MLVFVFRDGLQKLYDVYKQNNKMGDPRTLDAQLAQNAHDLDSLEQALRKYEVRIVPSELRHNAVLTVVL